MSADRSEATEDNLGASNVDNCEGSQRVSHIQQREASFTDADAQLETIKRELFACFRLPGVLSGSRQQIENASKKEERQLHWIRRGEQSLLADGSRKKTSGANKERDIQ